MNHNYIRSATFGALMLFCASMVNAQELANLGELLDKDGKRLDAVELKALLAGATVSGKPFGTKPGSDTEFETTFAIDGTFKGRLFGQQFHLLTNPDYSGTWSINEQGQNCTDTFGRAIGRVKACSAYYNLNNVYYAAPTDDRGAAVRTRKIKRSP